MAQDVIAKLKSLKKQLEERAFTQGSSLEKAFFRLIDDIFDPIKDFYTHDLNDLSQAIIFLTQQVVQIHKNEENQITNKLNRETLNLKIVGTLSKDASRGDRIYYFNDTSWENYVMGDIHSDSIVIKAVLKRSRFFKKLVASSKVRLIFLGDYVDRGKAHLKLLVSILALKYLFPQNIYYLKGNHDQGTFSHGQIKMGVRQPEKDKEEDWFLPYLFMLSQKNPTFHTQNIHGALAFFDSLAILACLNFDKKTYLLVHAGLPRHKYSLTLESVQARQSLQEELDKQSEGNASKLRLLPSRDKIDVYDFIKHIAQLTEEKELDFLDRSLVNNMLWSDPYNNQGDLREEFHRFRFSVSSTISFLNHFKVDAIIRGHQVQEEGHHFFHGNRIINIFTSGYIMDNGENINTETAYSQVYPRIIRFNQRGDMFFLKLSPRDKNKPKKRTP